MTHIELFTVDGRTCGPYPAERTPVLCEPDEPIAFSRQTAGQIACDLNGQDAGYGLTAEWNGDDLLFTWDKRYRYDNGTRKVSPDDNDLYWIGGLWRWMRWGDTATADFQRAATSPPVDVRLDWTGIDRSRTTGIMTFILNPEQDRTLTNQGREPQFLLTGTTGSDRFEARNDYGTERFDGEGTADQIAAAAAEWLGITAPLNLRIEREYPDPQPAPADVQWVTATPDQVARAIGASGRTAEAASVTAAPAH